VSATNRALTKRHPFDAYSTPAWVTEAIAREIVWGKDPFVLEPCCGEHAITRVIQPRYTEHVVEFDIQRGTDFLEEDMSAWPRFDFVITNPPFTYAQEFVDKSLKVANCVIMLLRLNFLASRQRKEWWQKHPPTAIHVLTKRPSFTGKGTDATDYAWFVWDTTGRQKRGLYWL
jgi:hypothetical protein